MRNPTREEQLALHERVLKKEDPLVSTDVFRTYMDLLTPAVMKVLRCDEDTAHDAMVDVLLAYLQKPERYDPTRALPVIYLVKAARYRALDKIRSRESRVRREKEHAGVEDALRTPKEKMEDSVEANHAVERLVRGKYLKNAGDWGALRLILLGERSTEVLAHALGLGELSKEEMQKEVKRHRDRLMRLLERFGQEDPR